MFFKCCLFLLDAHDVSTKSTIERLGRRRHFMFTCWSVQIEVCFRWCTQTSRKEVIVWRWELDWINLGWINWINWLGLFRNNCPKVFFLKKVFLEISKFTGKHLYRSLFSIKLQASILLKKRRRHRVFPWILEKILRTPFKEKDLCRLLLFFDFKLAHRIRNYKGLFRTLSNIYL